MIAPVRVLDAIAHWWFTPASSIAVRSTRVMLAILAVCYFLDAWVDVGDWFASGQPHASLRIATFLTLAGIGDAVSTSISPLFVFESTWIYQAYLAIGVALSVTMAAGYGGRVVKLAVWMLVVFWGNRLLWLSGLAETSLSLSLAAIALAPERQDDDLMQRRWNGFALRLVAVQMSLFTAATWLGMAAGEVWWDGTGSIALNAPLSSRTFDFTDWLVVPVVHDGLTHLMMLLPPLGLLLAWLAASASVKRVGVACLLIWWAMIAVLASAWIHAAVLAVGMLAIRSTQRLSAN